MSGMTTSPHHARGTCTTRSRLTRIPAISAMCSPLIAKIGIMRAIGADDRAVMRTVIAEGVVIGLITFAFAVLLSIPFTYLLSTIVSLAVFQTPIDVVFTLMGYGIWLGLVLVLSAVASILPARNAARLTIREVLAYE